MLRKFSLVAIAAASLAATALAPTSASAWNGWRDGWHRGGGHGHFDGAHAYYGYGGHRHHRSHRYDGCYARRLVVTPWGPRLRLVNRCY